MKVSAFNTSAFQPSAEDGGKPIEVRYGTWPWQGDLFQRFDKTSASLVASALAKILDGGGLGIPVYAGHPDVPELAAKYPDKAALGWIRRVDVGDDACKLFVEWDRYPSKGFAYFSPYWFGEVEIVNGKKTVVVDELRSVGLVNRPRIGEFRLPNEAGDEKGEKAKMELKKILALLGLPDTATEDDVVAAVADMKERADSLGDVANAASAAKADLANACAAQKKVANELTEERAAHEATRAALANERAEVERLKSLKTKSVTEGLANEGGSVAAHDQRMGLVNELMTSRNLSYADAWEVAKRQKPELFK